MYIIELICVNSLPCILTSDALVVCKSWLVIFFLICVNTIILFDPLYENSGTITKIIFFYNVFTFIQPIVLKDALKCLTHT